MSDKNGFQLRKIPSILTPTDPLNRAKSGLTYNLPFEKLQPYKNHPFKIYEGERFINMVESIKANGVFIPIIVRPLDGEIYEVLSGHNRVEAAKAAGFDVIPAIIREGLTDEEALIIVTETNLLQRSFADLSHSERAVTLAMHYEAIKQQGKRTNLINEIEDMVNASNIADDKTTVPMEQKLNAREKTAHDYGLDSNNVARYLRINKLIQPHKDRLDNGELAMRAGVTLSYLSEEQQMIVDDVLCANSYKVDMKKSELLRSASEKKSFTCEYAEQILSGLADKRKDTARHTPSFKIKGKILSKYFKPGDKPDEIEAVITKALELYYSQNPKS